MKTNKDYLEAYNKKQAIKDAEEAKIKAKQIREIVQSNRVVEEITKIEKAFEDGDLSYSLNRPSGLSSIQWEHIAKSIEMEFRNRGFSVWYQENLVCISIMFEKDKDNNKLTWKQKLRKLFLRDEPVVNLNSKDSAYERKSEEDL